LKVSVKAWIVDVDVARMMGEQRIANDRQLDLNAGHVGLTDSVVTE
jgi:hypothetical protein